MCFYFGGRDVCVVLEDGPDVGTKGGWFVGVPFCYIGRRGFVGGGHGGVQTVQGEVV